MINKSDTNSKEIEIADEIIITKKPRKSKKDIVIEVADEVIITEKPKKNKKKDIVIEVADEVIITEKPKKSKKKEIIIEVADKIKGTSKNKKNINVLDLFCGCGGMSKGLTDAGLNIIAGIDIWDKAINSYKKNYEHAGICADLTKLTPEKFQELYNKDGKVIDVIVGGPPCFVEGTLILTENGYQNIKNITLNDKVLTHTGKYQKILNLQTKIYTDELYELKVRYHPNIITTTKDHPFYIRTKVQKWNNDDRKYNYSFEQPIWKKASELTDNDYYGMVINTNNIIPEFTFHKKINQFKSEEKNIILNDKKYWYLLGYFVGDGWIEETVKRNGNPKHIIKFAINNKDEEEVLPKLQKILPITDQKCDSGKCKKFGCSNFEWFSLLKQFGKYAHGKLIPNWVHDAPIEFIQEFINGYMKADGNIKKNDVLNLTTVSENLAFGVQRLYLKLGYIFAIQKIKMPSTKIIDGRTVNQRDFYQIRGKLIKERNVSSFIEDNYAWFPPYTITKKENNSIQVYNFEVETDNSYCVENLIVHNCQGFSIAGRRDANDPRNSLFMEYLKYLNYFKPKMFLMENVIGILSMKTDDNGKVIDIIINLLKENYNVSINKLYASDFGVPQNRRRVIIIGIRKDLKKLPMEPEPTIKNTEDRVPVKTILLPMKDVDESYYLSEKALAGIKAKKEKSIINKTGFGAQFLDLDKPSFTIPARYWKDGYDALVKYSDTKIRRLTILELKRIQTFPDNYIIEGSKKDIIMQIGNAVACKFAKALGLYIIKTFETMNIPQ